MARLELPWDPFDLIDPGPCLDVIVTNSREVIDVMEEGNPVGLDYPKPVKIKALLDTGASITVISRTYGDYCKLFQTGEGTKIAAIGAIHSGVEHAAAISFFLAPICAPLIPFVLCQVSSPAIQTTHV